MLTMAKLGVPKLAVACWLNSETLIEEVPLLSTCAAAATATAAATAMVSKYQFEFAAKNSDFFGIFGTKFKLIFEKA